MWIITLLEKKFSGGGGNGVAGELFNSSQADPDNTSLKTSLFLEDSAAIFFRRLAFTPKGGYLVVRLQSQ